MESSQAYLLDTCTFLWLCLDDGKVSDRARKIVDSLGSRELYLSVISEWEITLKFGLGKLSLPKTAESFLVEAKDKLCLESLLLSSAHVYRFGLLSTVNKDPFDKMLAAQAIETGLSILTPDLVIARYGARTMW